MPAAGLRPRHVVVEGVQVRYVRMGTGPTIVLLHGFASSIVTWKDVLPVLAQQHDVIAMDLPGFGGSDIPSRLTPDLQARVVLGVLDQLAVRRASLVGNSLGGALALVLAATQPDRVERLVLIDAAGFNFAMADRPLLLRALTVLPGAGLLDRSPRRRWLIDLGLRQVFHDDRLVTPERVDEYVVPLLRPRAAVALQQLLRSPDDLGFPGIVARIRQPTLVIWGRNDVWIPPENARRFAASLKDARVVLLDACGHMPQEEKPEDTATLIAEFLAPG